MKLAIFDLDGVIVSTDELHYAAWKTVMDDADLKFNDEMNDQIRGLSRDASLHTLLRFNQATLADEVFDEKLEVKNQLYRDNLSTLSEKDILPGVLQLITYLRREGVKLAIGSSSRNAEFILDQLKLTSAFDAIVTGNDVTQGKPDPEVFQKSATALGVAVEECIVFEDAQAGVDAARNAGMRVVGVGTATLTGATLLVTDLRNIELSLLAECMDEH